MKKKSKYLQVQYIIRYFSASIQFNFDKFVYFILEIFRFPISFLQCPHSSPARGIVNYNLYITRPFLFIDTLD